MEDLSMEARNRAGGKFKSGANCAESILQTFNEMLDNPLPEEVMKIATGFGGGLGHAGCLCGALTSSVMVLGLYRGRTSPAEDRGPAYDLAREFHDKFKNEFGGTCCRKLNKFEFDSTDHLRHCLKLTGNTAKMLMDFIQDKQLTLPAKK